MTDNAMTLAGLGEQEAIQLRCPHVQDLSATQQDARHRVDSLEFALEWAYLHHV